MDVDPLELDAKTGATRQGEDQEQGDKPTWQVAGVHRGIA
jgi:hypothetical protein